MTASGISDRWTFCSLGHAHWGALGGAGLLLRYVPAKGSRNTCLLSVPGGKMKAAPGACRAAPSITASRPKRQLTARPLRRTASDLTPGPPEEGSSRAPEGS
jgi:hypothetical protein